jgi:spermidine/putrescine-binding protein
MKHSSHPIRRPFDRRRFMSGAGAAIAAATAGETLFPRTKRAKATPAADNVVRVLGISNGMPNSWAEFEEDTGLKVEWTPIGDDVGVFLHEMIASDAGDHYDIVTCLSGTYEMLADQDLLLPIDTAKLASYTTSLESYELAAAHFRN